MRYLVNAVLYLLKPLQQLFIPIAHKPSDKRMAVQKLQDCLQSDLPLGMFPAGACSRWIAGKRQDLPWHKTFLMQAYKYQRDIVPLYFHGRNSHHFYAVEWLRRVLGIKSNWASILLPDEMFRARGSEFKVVVGKPISWQRIPDAKAMPAMAQEVRSQCHALRPQLFAR